MQAAKQTHIEPHAQDRSHRLWSYVLLVAISAGVLFLDQWTKQWVRDNLSFGDGFAPLAGLAPYLRILHWRNSGAAFGMFQDGGGIFTILAVFVAAMIIYYFPRIGRGDWALRLAMGLQLGGALGNLVDRLQHGYVTDFVSVGSFPVFNVADSAISLGVIILLLDVWLNGEHREEPEPVAALSDEQARRS
jgi:signal peptidase II